MGPVLAVVGEAAVLRFVVVENGGDGWLLPVGLGEDGAMLGLMAIDQGDETLERRHLRGSALATRMLAVALEEIRNAGERSGLAVDEYGDG